LPLELPDNAQDFIEGRAFAIEHRDGHFVVIAAPLIAVLRRRRSLLPAA
jgi:hypothetical protein